MFCKKELLANTFSLTSYFRSLIGYPYSDEAVRYLLTVSGYRKEDLERRWEGFDKLFGEKKGKLISALSFATIIESRGILIDSILKNDFKDSIIVELASGFSTRAINLINNNGFNHNLYIETDKPNVISLKEGFYNQLDNVGLPQLYSFDVVVDDIDFILKLILDTKGRNQNCKKVIFLSEGLLIYLSFKQQKIFFDKLRQLQSMLKEHGIELTYLSTDLPTHQNFTDWLIHEGFSHKEHIEVMRNVEPMIPNNLYDTEIDFWEGNDINLELVRKYYYEYFDLQTSKLPKYKHIPLLNKKIQKFLSQQIMFAYIINFNKSF